jgi:hypothetical protein
MSVEEKYDVDVVAERSRQLARDFAESSRETVEEVSEIAKARIKELIDTADAQISKVQTMTKESPGKALAVTFIAGLTVGGLIALLALSRSQE